MFELSPLAIAFIVAFFCSQAGVSGGFLMLPIQISLLAVNPVIASSTNFLYNLITIPGGIFGYWREKRLFYPLSAIIISGYIPGIYLGSVVRTKLLIDPKLFKLFAGFVLLFVGYELLKSVYRKSSIDVKMEKFGKIVSGVKLETISIKQIKFRFWDEEYQAETAKIFLFAFIIGIISGTYGIGGGAITSGVLVAVFKFPAHTIAGANLLATMVASIVGIISYSSLGYSPSLELGISMGIGGALGAYTGSKTQKYVSERKIKILIGILTIAVAGGYILQYFS